MSVPAADTCTSRKVQEWQQCFYCCNEEGMISAEKNVIPWREVLRRGWSGLYLSLWWANHIFISPPCPPNIRCLWIPCKKGVESCTLRENEIKMGWTKYLGIFVPSRHSILGGGGGWKWGSKRHWYLLSALPRITRYFSFPTHLSDRNLTAYKVCHDD